VKYSQRPIRGTEMSPNERFAALTVHMAWLTAGRPNENGRDFSKAPIAKWTKKRDFERAACRATNTGRKTTRGR